MTTSLLQTVFSLPLQITTWLICLPWRNTRKADAEGISSESLTADEKASPLSDIEASGESQVPLPCYSKWPDEHFAISEYESKEAHFIDLTSYPMQDRLVAKALSIFRNKRPDYADPEIPYGQSLNLEETLIFLRQLVADEPDFRWTKREYYVVAYYSTLRASLEAEDRKLLAELDEAAFREALPSKAFVKYWFGRPDRIGRNLATCLWTNRSDAKRTLANGPYHRRAAGEGQGLYQKGTIDIREYSLTIDDDVDAWSINLISRRIHA